MKIKQFWNSDKIISISAMLISLMTLIVFILQTNIIREQQRLSVLPYLYMVNENSGLPTYKFKLMNNGIGPAFIESVNVRYKGKTFNMDIPTFLYQNVPEMDSVYNVFHSNLVDGQLIPAGKEIAIFEVNNSIEDAEKLLKVMRQLNDEGFDYEIVYKSIYEERWKLNSSSISPIKMD